MSPPILPPPVFGGGGAAAGGSPIGAGGGSAAASNAGPSEYTMMIRQATPPPPAPAEKPAAKAAPAKPARKIPLGLIIGVNVVLLLTIAFVLYFVLRPDPVEPVVDTPSVEAPDGAVAGASAPAEGAEAP